MKKKKEKQYYAEAIKYGAIPGKVDTMSMRMRLTRMLLRVSVFAWGILLGGKLFDLRVLAGAWGAPRRSR